MHRREMTMHGGEIEWASGSGERGCGLIDNDRAVFDMVSSLSFAWFA